MIRLAVVVDIGQGECSSKVVFIVLYIAYQSLHILYEFGKSTKILLFVGVSSHFGESKGCYCNCLSLVKHLAACLLLKICFDFFIFERIPPVFWFRGMNFRYFFRCNRNKKNQTIFLVVIILLFSQIFLIFEEWFKHNLKGKSGKLEKLQTDEVRGLRKLANPGSHNSDSPRYLKKRNYS